MGRKITVVSLTERYTAQPAITASFVDVANAAKFLGVMVPR